MPPKVQSALDRIAIQPGLVVHDERIRRHWRLDRHGAADRGWRRRSAVLSSVWYAWIGL